MRTSARSGAGISTRSVGLGTTRTSCAAESSPYSATIRTAPSPAKVAMPKASTVASAGSLALQRTASPSRTSSAPSSPSTTNVTVVPAYAVPGAPEKRSASIAGVGTVTVIVARTPGSRLL